MNACEGVTTEDAEVSYDLCSLELAETRTHGSRG